MNGVRRALLIVLALLAPGGAVRAENLLQNPFFDTNVAAWTPTSGASASWSPIDRLGRATSGSALVTNGNSSATAIEGLQQCVPATAGAHYHLAFYAEHPAGQTNNRLAGHVRFFSGPDCIGTPTGPLGLTYSGLDAGVWWNLDDQNLIAPVGAGSALVLLGVGRLNAGPSPVEAFFDGVYFGVLQEKTLTIPASASIHGRNETFFQTDLWLLNNSNDFVAPVAIRHLCLAGQTCSGIVATYPGPRDVAFFRDVIGSTLRDPETAGALEISFDAGMGNVTAFSRTYSPSRPAPTAGTGIPALPASEARTRAVLIGLATSGGNLTTGFRANVGFFNPGYSPVTVTVTLYSVAGEVLGTPVVRDVPARAADQVNDVFAAAGAGTVPADGNYAVVTATAPVFSYATVIDNQSSDSTYIAAADDPMTP